GGAHLDVAALQRARLAAHGAVEAGGEAADGGEGGDAEGHAGEERGELPPPGPRLAPGEARGERRHATRPSRSGMTRPAREATASSWVTSTSVLACSRFRASSRSTMRAPVSESRLPVG